MSWVLLAISSYFLLALVEIIDKYILSAPRIKPLAYAFSVGILGSAALILWLFDFSFLSPLLAFYAILSGISFFIALYFFNSAMISGEVSRVASFVGGISPIFIFILSYLFLSERLHFFSIAAFLMLIIGSITLSFAKNNGEELKFSRYFFFLSFMASLFFAASYFLTKKVFLETSFINGFVWMRAGTLICALFVLLIPHFRKSIFEGAKGFTRKLTTLFIFNKGISAIANLLLNYSVMLGSVAIVNALQSTIYLFVFILALLISYFRPNMIFESFTFKSLLFKSMGIGLVSGGICILFLGL